jgi:hypothetical protein
LPSLSIKWNEKPFSEKKLESINPSASCYQEKSVLVWKKLSAAVL